MTAPDVDIAGAVAAELDRREAEAAAEADREALERLEASGAEAGAFCRACGDLDIGGDPSAPCDVAEELSAEAGGFTRCDGEREAVLVRGASCELTLCGSPYHHASGRHFWAFEEAERLGVVAPTEADDAPPLVPPALEVDEVDGVMVEEAPVLASTSDVAAPPDVVAEELEAAARYADEDLGAATTDEAP